MTRLLSGVALAAAALAAILFLPVIGLRMLASLVAVLAAHEYLADRSHRASAQRGRAPVLLLVALTCWYMLLPDVQTLLALLVAAFALLVMEVLFGGMTIQDAASRFLAPWYIGMPLGMLVERARHQWRAGHAAAAGHGRRQRHGAVLFRPGLRPPPAGARPSARRRRSKGAIGGLVVRHAVHGARRSARASRAAAGVDGRFSA